MRGSEGEALAEAALFAHPAHVAPAELFHQLLDLVELLEQLVDLLHGGAGAGGDALGSG